MTDGTLNVETFTRRLENLERENRRLRRASGAVALLLAFSMLIGAQKTPAELDVSGLRILDGNRKVWATLDVGGLIFHDANGKVQAVLRGDGLSFHDAKEKVRSVLAGDGLSFHDGNENLRAELLGNRFFFYDASFKPLAGLAVIENGAGGLVLSEKLGAGLRLTKSGQGLVLSDATNKAIWSTQP